ncbi:MAG: hypothetical protein QXW01_01560 [Candidatus Aenigmatarchaeota archaeon]
MIEIRKIKGVKNEDLESWRYNILAPIEILVNFHIWDYEGNKIFRAFDPDRLNYVVTFGTDRTEDYISDYDRKDNVIYAGSLGKAMEYASKYFRRKNRACFSVYKEEFLDKVDIYAYKPKEGRSYLDALLGVVCIEG